MGIPICQVIFSTNRIEYLCRTLEAQKKLDFSGFDVDRIFIDDMPRGRNNPMITALVKSYGYNEIYLHEENLGLSLTWTKFWDMIKGRGYYWVWHQEDDVEVLEPIKVMELCELFQEDQSISQVVLKRQKWYDTEEHAMPKDTDLFFKNYRYEKDSVIFSPMASFYPISVVRWPMKEWYAKTYPDGTLHQVNLNEGLIGKSLYEGLGLKSVHLKNNLGQNLVNHIGDYFVGKRVLPGEPHYEMFAHYDPFKKYNSKDGSEYTQ